MITVYHTIFEEMISPTPPQVKSLHDAIEHWASTMYPEDYTPPTFLPEVDPDVQSYNKLISIVGQFVDSQGLEKTCIEARRALVELTEKIGVML